MKLNLKNQQNKAKQSEVKKQEAITIQNSQDLANFIKASRKKQNLSQAEVAQFANISRLAVSEFENGKSDIKLSTLLKLIKACSLSLEVMER